MTNDEFLSDLLYCAHMGELPESTIAEACERFGIDFPPKRYDYSKPIPLAQRMPHRPVSGKADHRQAALKQIKI